MDATRLEQRPVVFVHGAWHGAWCWDKWLEIFRAAGFSNVIPVEFRGHGYKTGSFKRARLDNYIQDVETVIDKVGGRPILIGHSLGCTVIRHLQEQDRFTAAVLLAPVPDARTFRKVFIKQIFRHPIFAGQSLALGTMQPWVSSKRSARLFFSDHMPREVADKYVDRMQGESFRLFALDLLRDRPTNKLGMPGLVVAASDDKFFNPAVQRKTAEQLNADFMTSDRSGHDIMLDYRSVETAARVIDWLKSVPTAA